METTGTDREPTRRSSAVLTGLARCSSVVAGAPPPGCFEKRGRKPLKTKETNAEKSAKRRQRGGKRLKERDLPPRVFCKKSSEVVENKRWERGKERKERKRVCKPLKTKGRQFGV